MSIIEGIKSIFGPYLDESLIARDGNWKNIIKNLSPSFTRDPERIKEILENRRIEEEAENTFKAPWDRGFVPFDPDREIKPAPMPGAIEYPDFFFTEEGDFIDPMGSGRIVGGTPGRAEEGYGRGKGRKGPSIATMDYRTLTVEKLIDRYGISREQAEKIYAWNLGHGRFSKGGPRDFSWLRDIFPNRGPSGPGLDRHPEEMKFDKIPRGDRPTPNWGDNEADPTIMDSERGRAANGGRIGYALGGSGNQMLNDSAQGIGSMVAFNDEEDYSLDDDALRTDPMELLDQIEAQGTIQTADMGTQEDPLMLYIMEQYEMMKDQGNLPAKYMGTNGMKLFLEEVGPVIISELEKQQGAGIASLQA